MNKDYREYPAGGRSAGLIKKMHNQISGKEVRGEQRIQEAVFYRLGESGFNQYDVGTRRKE
jgi:hypothetical protein